ncbi:MAG: NAD(P)H-hydrate dehydratase [Candidatus Hydrogenedentes bacterium]|nr:NAD(P)H-hydrate dehydratase [Candidatus Hydrogenedentota bacterium]
MATELTLDDIRGMLSPRPDTGHKGTFGHVLVIAGSRGFTGAAILAAEGAGRSGAGLVTVASPQPVIGIIASKLLEAMWIGLPATKLDTFAAEATAPALAAAAARQAVVIGPGVSTQDDTRRFVLDFLKQCVTPMVLDADALNIAGINPGVLANALAPIVVTPHPGEMARLAGMPVENVQRDREAVAIQFSIRYKTIVVLKGHRTVIAAPDGSCHVNPTGNSGMATGGTGDVLGGLIAGLIAQGVSPADAARAGVYTHGVAGDIAAQERSRRGMIARDLLEALPRAWRQIEGE